MPTPLQLKLIHVAARQVGLDDGRYRLLLRNVGGVDSSKALSQGGIDGGGNMRKFRYYSEAQRAAIVRGWEAFRAGSGLAIEDATRAFLRSLKTRRPARATLYNWRARAALGNLADGRAEIRAARRRIARQLWQLPLARLLIVEKTLASWSAGRAIVAAEAAGGVPVAMPAACAASGSATAPAALNGV